MSTSSRQIFPEATMRSRQTLLVPQSLPCTSQYQAKVFFQISLRKSSSETKQQSLPSTSPGRGARVVRLTESSNRGEQARSLLTRVLLPTPEGPTSTRAGNWRYTAPSNMLKLTLNKIKRQPLQHENKVLGASIGRSLEEVNAALKFNFSLFLVLLDGHVIEYCITFGMENSSSPASKLHVLFSSQLQGGLSDQDALLWFGYNKFCIQQRDSLLFYTVVDLRARLRFSYKCFQEIKSAAIHPSGTLGFCLTSCTLLKFLVCEKSIEVLQVSNSQFDSLTYSPCGHTLAAMVLSKSILVLCHPLSAIPESTVQIDPRYCKFIKLKFLSDLALQFRNTLLDTSFILNTESIQNPQKSQQLQCWRSLLFANKVVYVALDRHSVKVRQGSRTHQLYDSTYEIQLFENLHDVFVVIGTEQALSFMQVVSIGFYGELRQQLFLKIPNVTAVAFFRDLGFLAVRSEQNLAFYESEFKAYGGKAVARFWQEEHSKLLFSDLSLEEATDSSGQTICEPELTNREIIRHCQRQNILQQLQTTLDQAKLDFTRRVKQANSRREDLLQKQGALRVQCEKIERAQEDSTALMVSISGERIVQLLNLQSKFRQQFQEDMLELQQSMAKHRQEYQELLEKNLRIKEEMVAECRREGRKAAESLTRRHKVELELRAELRDEEQASIRRELLQVQGVKQNSYSVLYGLAEQAKLIEAKLEHVEYSSQRLGLGLAQEQQRREVALRLRQDIRAFLPSIEEEVCRNMVAETSSGELGADKCIIALNQAIQAHKEVISAYSNNLAKLEQADQALIGELQRSNSLKKLLQSTSRRLDAVAGRRKQVLKLKLQEKSKRNRELDRIFFELNSAVISNPGRVREAVRERAAKLLGPLQRRPDQRQAKEQGDLESTMVHSKDVIEKMSLKLESNKARGEQQVTELYNDLREDFRHSIVAIKVERARSHNLQKYVKSMWQAVSLAKNKQAQTERRLRAQTLHK